MQAISEEDIIRRIRVENPWWESPHQVSLTHRSMTPRPYLDLFLHLMNEPVRRAVVLMGPRRVGKTVMIHHALQSLLTAGIRPNSICYISVDSPIYNGLSLERLLEYYSEATGVDYQRQSFHVFFDEIQYLKNWEVQLKSIVDTYPSAKCVVSGSAAAALRLKSHESGAGRFSDFLLPPLTFYEFLHLVGKTDLLAAPPQGVDDYFIPLDISALNDQFIQYLNYGGYPEVILSPHMQANPSQFIKSDIIDKVLLRDLPSLYGIEDIQELNYLFTTLAFNTANEVSLQELSQNSGVAKNTIKRYIDYLEAAFLIKTVHRVDHSAKRFQRANFFKVYLTNPSMRAALFSPLTEADQQATGSLAETALFAQWFHSDELLHYARWQGGEVDMVSLGANLKPVWAVEVKWSDRYSDDPKSLPGLLSFMENNGLPEALVTSRTKTNTVAIDGIVVRSIPTSVYCYTVGYNLIRHKRPRQTSLAGA